MPTRAVGTQASTAEFTYLYIAPQGYIEAGATDNYYVTKEFTNTSTKNVDGRNG